MTNLHRTLIRHNFIYVPDGAGISSKEEIATIMMNLSYYGYSLNVEAYNKLLRLSPPELAAWWCEVEKEFKSLTGDDRNMGNFVVYKNFPKEVLDKTELEYWLPQLLMYWGLPNEHFTEPVEPRQKMKKVPTLKVLAQSSNETPAKILENHVYSPSRWKDDDFSEVVFLTKKYSVDFAKFGFKENLVKFATYFIEQKKNIEIKTGTDILRLAAGLSNADVSLREKPKFHSFNRQARKYFLSLLENCPNLFEDVARRPEMWKRLFHNLHVGDYSRQFPKVCAVYNSLYKNELETFNSRVEKLLSAKDSKVLDLLSSRPGDFKRRLVHVIELFGDKAVSSFLSVIDKLNTSQIVSLRSFLRTVNKRRNRTFPPKGNWNNLQIGEARHVNGDCLRTLESGLEKELCIRLPKVKFLDKDTRMVKLPNNGEVGYTRGTIFPLPKDVDFIRTASYWQKKMYHNVWFDNGWNFFDLNWNALGACCWNAIRFHDGAVFSGDPTNSKEMDGKAAQMIDLYPEKLKEHGVRFAIWNILCYSHIPFSDATDVFAALQWGTGAQTSKLFEPSRCQLSFPLKGKQLTKYICCLDLEKNEMIYLDANLRAKVSSASYNSKALSDIMPAFMEYIQSLPSVYDLFSNATKSENGIYILYSDKDTDLRGETAYIFKQENKENRLESLDLNKILCRP